MAPAMPASSLDSAVRLRRKGACPTLPVMRFGPYELDLESGDLRKFGYRIKLQPKSFLVLRALLQAPGEMVTREQLRAQLWPENTFVEFESSLNVAVRRLREALNDEAQGPSYIETVPKHGYRFIGVLEPPAAAASPYLGPALVHQAADSASALDLPLIGCRASKLSRPEVGGSCCCRPWRC